MTSLFPSCKRREKGSPAADCDLTYTPFQAWMGIARVNANKGILGGICGAIKFAGKLEFMKTYAETGGEICDMLAAGGPAWLVHLCGISAA
ncbi:hypothetical protein ETD86_29350 [Nonomuraea turkmeniaca]|uniref:Uncharacterized protein n=1 Tax=Nonomuraea turkmeniaca TaxID=103838 RepID=A0A5S4FAN8_9ACTN|nr:hypothetical protein [Nonomuraea turkmeniaca]TMR14135.1 hypothetical protein ETD86_29350 [Nonomuraea turkmeniaca]